MWWLLLGGIIGAGIGSRVGHTGFRVFDKYLGDALYAAMVYALIRLSGRTHHVLPWSAAAMAAIECFQWTGIPEGMSRSAFPPARACAILLGTQFSLLDLLAYAVGLACIAAFDRTVKTRGRPR